jgi:dTDP-4-dehydrorhamnose reductase
MLGSAAFRILSEEPSLTVYGTARSDAVRQYLGLPLRSHLLTGIDALDIDSLLGVIQHIRPQVILNCVGIVKQLPTAKDPLVTLPVNAMFPHRLARVAALSCARLIHISTDCVFRGLAGNYAEDSVPDANDLYGRSKLLGEVDYPNAITLRTSIIGRELGTRNGLLEWFLHASSPVRGFTRAIFSGLPTDELARIIIRYVLPRSDLTGVWHVGAAAISKYDLLLLLREAYGHEVQIEPDSDTVVIDRSLNSGRFRAATGYDPPPWPTLIANMRTFGRVT